MTWNPEDTGGRIVKADVTEAVHELFRRFDFVDYFPSYEIVLNSPRAIAFARHSGEPTSHSNESSWRSRRPGTSSGSLIFANDARCGAPGIVEVDWRLTAKMRPSNTTLFTT